LLTLGSIKKLSTQRHPLTRAAFGRSDVRKVSLRSKQIKKPRTK
jgi:hypothetical protein